MAAMGSMGARMVAVVGRRMSLAMAAALSYWSWSVPAAHCGWRCSTCAVMAHLLTLMSPLAVIVREVCAVMASAL